MNQSINTDSKNSKEPQQKYRLGTVSIKILGGLNRFYRRLTSPSASIMTQNIQLNDEAQKLQGELTYGELTWALKNMKNSKRPGNDDLQQSFSFFFLDKFGCIWSMICKLCIQAGFIIYDTKTRDYNMCS